MKTKKQKKYITIQQMVLAEELGKYPTICQMMQDCLFDLAEYVKKLLENPPQRPDWPIRWQLVVMNCKKKTVAVDLLIHKFPDSQISWIDYRKQFPVPPIKK